MVYMTRQGVMEGHNALYGEDAVKEVAGVFMSITDLQSAIRDLEGSAFPRHDISIMGSRGDLEEVFGSKTIEPEKALSHNSTPRQAPSRPEEQTIGIASVIGGSAYIGAMAVALAAGAAAFPAILSAAVIGGLGGGTLGVILTRILGDRYERHIEEQIRKGGLLLWARTPDLYKQELARQIMVINNGYNVHVQSQTAD